jgi:hypothetical protein
VRQRVRTGLARDFTPPPTGRSTPRRWPGRGHRHRDFGVLPGEMEERLAVLDVSTTAASCAAA